MAFFIGFEYSPTLRVSHKFKLIATMAESETDSNNEGKIRPLKRQREEPVTIADLMVQGRKIWAPKKNPHKPGAPQNEDRKFRETFGAGPFVLLELWQLLVKYEFLPDGGTLEKFLWTFSFMKSQGTITQKSKLCGDIDPDRLRKWAFLFIGAVADMEYLIVSHSVFCS